MKMFGFIFEGLLIVGMVVAITIIRGDRKNKT